MGIIGSVACSDPIEMTTADTGSTAMDATADADAAADTGPSDTGSIDADIEDTGLFDAGSSEDAGDAGAFCNQTAIAEVTAEEAIAQADTLDGEVIVLTGTATSGQQLCTLRACPPNDPCCNVCTADVLVGSITFVSSACVDDVGCGGTECGLVCRPPTLGLPGRYRGILRAGPPATFEYLGLQ
ncbi:MAG: hypothetical protein AAF449_00920 [Myxococcota bacterium]